MARTRALRGNKRHSKKLDARKRKTQVRKHKKSRRVAGMVPIQGLKRYRSSPAKSLSETSSKSQSKSPSSSQENSPADRRNKWWNKKMQFRAQQRARSLARKQNPNYDAEQAAQKVAKETEDLEKLLAVMNTK
jgi:hypothetical protein